MQNRRILIVDDNQALHEDFKKILASDNKRDNTEMVNIAESLFGKNEKIDRRVTLNVKFELDFALQGEDALNKAIAAHESGNPFALIFMDVRMPPGWDGIVTVGKIWEKIPNIEVVIWTANSDYSLDDILENLGLSDRLLFLKKPFDSVEVQQMALTLATKWNLEKSNCNHIENLEELVDNRTKELEFLWAKSINSSKLAALGEMTGGIDVEDKSESVVIFFTTKKLGQGTGLGLSISKGTLMIDTRSPHTRFVIVLPKNNNSNLFMKVS